MLLTGRNMLKDTAGPEQLAPVLKLSEPAGLAPLLNFLYDGEARPASLSHVRQRLLLARKFGVPELRAACCKTMCNTRLASDPKKAVSDWLELAAEFDLTPAIAHCLAFVRQGFFHGVIRCTKISSKFSKQLQISASSRVCLHVMLLVLVPDALLERNGHQAGYWPVLYLSLFRAQRQPRHVGRAAVGLLRHGGAR